MHLLLLILGILLLLILIPILVLGIVAYTKLRNIWYKMTGRQPSNSGPHFRFTTSYGDQGNQGNQSSNAQQQSSNTQHTSQPGSTKKIFSANEGEYVDFEVVD